MRWNEEQLPREDNTKRYSVHVPNLIVLLGLRELPVQLMYNNSRPESMQSKRALFESGQRREPLEH